MLNNHDALSLGYYYARPLCTRTKGKQTVIQDGDVKPCKRFPLRFFFGKLGARHAYDISEKKRNGSLRFIMLMRISHDYVPVFV